MITKQKVYPSKTLKNRERKERTGSIIRRGGNKDIKGGERETGRKSQSTGNQREIKGIGRLEGREREGETGVGIGKGPTEGLGSI